MGLVLLPDFALIFIGWLLYRGLDWSDDFWSTLEKLIFFVLFPALLFISVVRTQFYFEDTTNLLYTALLTTSVGILIGYALRWVSGASPMTFSSGVQCAFRFNSYIGLALASRLGGDTGIALMALLLGFNVPFCNFVAIWGLAAQGRFNVWRELARNPLILATLGGLLLNVLNYMPPDSIMVVLDRLGSASTALGLISIGAGLRFSGVVEAKMESIGWLMTKLIICPGFAWWLGQHLGLSALQLKIVVLFGALPSASSAYILATRMSGNGPLVAFLISASTLLSMVTIPFWLGML